MSIAILTQVYDEMRRLAIAGAVVAPGDFRLQKLVSPLEQAAAKAPVFGKAAEAVKAVVGSNEKNSADALLELTALVNAVLYTQGETGAAGTLQDIETTNLEVPTAQTSSRLLKPLLEALTTTGAGRLELIRDAHERGAFRDLRLVKPALEALDDVYGEIADLVAEKVLPIYGKAILPELRAKFDPKGRGGHPRRLRLMHRLDPASSREFIKQSLEEGSKEVKIVAIECLGAEEEDLSHLLEQATAKTQEIRQAAYRALARLDDEPAVAVLQKALLGKDLDLAADSLRQCQNSVVLDSLLAEAERELTALPKTKDKKETSLRVGRIQSLLGCLGQRQDRKSEAFLLRVFEQRSALEKVKGASIGGADLNQTVVQLMSEGTRKLQTALAEAHASLCAEELGACFRAARAVLPPAEVFDRFSPYLTPRTGEKKKSRDPAVARGEAIRHALECHYYPWSIREENAAAPLDPRWLDAAVAAKDLELIRALVRPGHAGLNAFIQETFEAVLKKSKHLNDCHEVVSIMVQAAHPQATDAFIATFEKHGKKADYYTYWFARLIPDLPRAAVPALEAMLPELSDKAADSLIDYIHQLRGPK